MNKLSILTFILFSITLVSAIGNNIPVQIQTTDDLGNIVTGTYEFTINISNSSTCSPVLYSNISTKTTDNRGIVSYDINPDLDFSEQYYLCYYRDGVSQDNKTIGINPYAFRANVSDYLNPLNNYEVENITASYYSGDGSLLTGLLGGGDINGVTTLGDYLSGGADSGVVNLLFNETRLNQTIDSRGGGDTWWGLNEGYVYNNSNSLDFNETLLNETIDLRDSDTTYTNGTGISLTGTTFSIILSYFQGLFIELTDSFGGEVSGTYDNIVLNNDALDDQYVELTDLPLANLTTPYCGNITGAVSNLCTITDSGAETDPYWTANQSSYSTTADILAFGYYNSSDFIITDYFTKTQIENFNYYNSSDFSISDYFTSSEILAFDYYNSTDFDITNYFTSAQILGFNYYNSTDFIITDYYTKTEVDNFNYYNATDFSISDYFTKADIEGFGYYNSSNFVITDYYTKTQIDNFDYYNSSDFVITDYATNVKVDSLGNFSTYIQPTHLTNFTDDLGDRGYTSVSNFTNDLGYYNSSDFSISDYYLLSNPYEYYNSTTIPNYILSSDEGNLNVNSSDYWDNYNVASDLNNLIEISGENITSGTIGFARLPTLDYLILIKWDNISDAPTALSFFDDDLGDRGYTHLTNFTDDLGDRGYTHLTNFTNDLGIGNWSEDSVNYYNTTETDTEITNANTSMLIYVDGTFITQAEEGNLNVNSSDYWDSYDTANSTWFENIAGALSLKLSQLTTWTDSWLSEKTTDDLTEGSVNLYDNQSWNESYGNDLYVNIDGDTMTGDLNMSTNDITNVGNLTLQDYTNGSVLFIDEDGRIAEHNSGFYFEINGTGGKLAVGSYDKLRNVIQAVVSDNKVDPEDIKGLIAVRNTHQTNNTMAGFTMQTVDGDGDVYSGARILTNFTSHNDDAISGDLLFETRHEGTRSVKMEIASDGDVEIYNNLTVDGYINGRFNWTTTDEWSSFDGSIFDFNESQLKTTYFLANSTQVVTGTGAGILTDIHAYDLVFYNITEVASDFELIVNFTEITEFTTLLVRHKTSINDGHSATIQIWNYDDSRWDGYGYLSEESTSRMQTFGVYDDDKHISEGVVQVRFYQNELPGSAHIHSFDWVGLSKGFGTPVGEEIDPYSIYKDGTKTLTGNWNAGAYNITASTFLGKWNGSSDYYLKTNPYSFYNSTTLTTNSQLLNGNNYWNDTYATFNESYADTIYADISVTGDNSSWNESYADTLYYDIDNPYGYYNSSNFNISDYASTIYADSLGNFSAWDKDYADLINTPTLLSNFTDELGDRGYTHLTNFTNNLGIGNWTLDKVNYYTSTEVDTEITNANTSVVNWVDSLFPRISELVGLVGNWSLDKPDYSTTTEADLLYAPINYGDDWNKTYGDTLYAPINYGDDWNKTYADTLYADISVTGDNSSWNESYADTLYISGTEAELNVNSSDYWDNIGTINTTQMENNGGTLNILTSWLTTFFNNLFSGKTTDDLSEGSTNLYDNSSWNETRADTLYADISVVNLTEDEIEAFIFDDDNTANLNLSGYNLTVNYIKFDGGGYAYDNSTHFILGRE